MASKFTKLAGGATSKSFRSHGVWGPRGVQRHHGSGEQGPVLSGSQARGAEAMAGDHHDEKQGAARRAVASIKDAKLIEYARAVADAYVVIVTMRSGVADYRVAADLAIHIAALAPDL